MMENEVEQVAEMRELMKKCIAGMAHFMAPEDILNIANSMAFEMAQYRAYTEKADAELEGDNNPTALADKCQDAIILSREEHPVLDVIRDLPQIVAAAALKSSVVPYAERIIDIVNEDDYEVTVSIASALVDMLRMTVGDNLDSMNDDEINQYGQCSKDIESLSDLVFDGIDVDMMGFFSEEPPESLDRGVNAISKEDYENSFSPGGGTDMGTAKAIISRLSLEEKDKAELLAMAEEKNDDGHPKYTTSCLINEANKRITSGQSGDIDLDEIGSVGIFDEGDIDDV